MNKMSSSIDHCYSG